MVAYNYKVKEYITKPLLFINVFILLLASSCKKERSCENCRGDSLNHPPVANAGQDKVITLPINSVDLDGSGSADPDNNIASYLWSKVSGPSSVIISNSNAVKTSVTNLISGSYEFELKVTDADGLFSKDTVYIRVDNVPANPPGSAADCVIPGSTQVGSFSGPRVDLVSIVYNDKIYYSGGSVMEIFDPASGSIIGGSNLSMSRAHLSALSAGDKLFFAGGYIYPATTNSQGTTVSRIDVYNTTNGTWTIAELSMPRYGISACTIGNKVLFAGGMTDVYTATSRVDIYDLSTNSWSQRELSQPGRFVSAIVGNKVWFVTHNSSQIDIYDALTDSWSTTLLSSPIYNTLPAVIYNNAALTLNNKIYFTGCKIVPVYDIPSNSWSSITLTENKFYIPAIICNNKIAFIGGMTNWFVYSSTIEVYDPATNSWNVQYMSSDLYYESLISYNNYIYSAGGVINQENTSLSSICKFQL